MNAALHVLSAGLPLWEEILAVPCGVLAYVAIWALLEWPGRAARKRRG